MTEINKKPVKKSKKIFNGFSIEVYKNCREVKTLITGVIGISDFTTEEIYIRTQGGKISIAGKNLCLVILESKTVEIRGEVENINFG